MFNKLNRSRAGLRVIALTTLTLFTAFQAHAAKCTQKDLNGTWTWIGTDQHLKTGKIWDTYRCVVRVNNRGKVIASKSYCEFRDSTGKYKSNIVGGRLKLSSSCEVSGQLLEDWGEGYGRYDFVMDWGRLTRDKQGMIGAGYYKKDKNLISEFNALKH